MGGKHGAMRGKRTDRQKNQLKGHRLGLEGESRAQLTGGPGSFCSG